MEDNRKYLIVGLGNSESKYEGTRHNIGFDIVAAFAKKMNLTFSVDRFAYVAKGRLKGRNITLILPTTFMNLSGKAVRYWVDKEKIAIENVLIVTDDIDLPLGKIRLKQNGGGGTHNGLNHIIEIVGHQNFPRLRFGIGKEFARGFQVEYVLGRFSSSELKVISPAIAVAVEAMTVFCTVGLQQAMNQYNNYAPPTTDLEL